ncbi:maleylpyruvate isomerase N-terminal domain-containing protein [Streptomyces sp. NPDC051940]|uniref:maleylpyruvate isomerase N-terminal domain-containing protein n=1 Tax=Streptomyces sp. NPDC051940 TaxID=3155675 RepID=UPI0034334264
MTSPMSTHASSAPPRGAITPPHDRLLAHIEDRSAALRKAAAAVDLGAQVPSCPDWSVRDLVTHIGSVQRFWAVVVAAGPSDTPPARGEGTPVWISGDAAPPGPEAGTDELLSWAEESTALLIATLRAADPDSGCWTWWGASRAPQTVGAVARHQVQEAAVHAYDAQLAAGTPEALPGEVALDGIDEFLSVSYGTATPWPHPAARIDLRTTEGPAWQIALSEGGTATVTTEIPDAPRGDHDGSAEAEDSHAADHHRLTLHAPASDLALTLHRRTSADTLQAPAGADGQDNAVGDGQAGGTGDGDAALLDRLLAWPSLD